MPSLTVDIRHNSPLARRILDAVRVRLQSSRARYGDRHKHWVDNEKAAVAYMPETEYNALLKNKTDQGIPEYTTINIPYSYGALMASHTYWSSVFLSRTPVFQFAGRHGESEQQTQAMEALISYQMLVGEMTVPLYLWLLDAGKYGLGVVNVNWISEQSLVSEVEEVPVLFGGFFNTGKTRKQRVTRRIAGYQGNKLTNVRPYDFYPDPRQPVRFFQKGEFCACRVEIGWNQVLKRLEQGYYIEDTVTRLRQRQVPGDMGYSGDRVAGSVALQLPEPATYSDDETHNRARTRNSTFVGYEFCIELVPQNWGLGESTYPEKWMFTVDSDMIHILGAQPLGANHDKFPFAVLEYEPEGYSLSSRGIPEVLHGLNAGMNWLFNSHMYNVRATLNNTLVYDPSMIESADIQNTMPGGPLRLTPLAYGRAVRDVVMQLPVTDVTRTHLADMAELVEVGQRATGVSDSLMGQLPVGGRRSATEVRTSAGFGINRLKTVSEFFSAMGWAPLAGMLVANSQQYYDDVRKYRIVGQLAAEAGEQFIEVTPETILGMYDFVPVDGNQPIDQLAQAQMWQQILGQMSQIPELMQNYSIGRIFEWVAQLAGLKNINQFRVETLPDALIASEAAKGNVVPIHGGDGSVAPSQPPGAGGPGSGPGVGYGPGAGGGPRRASSSGRPPPVSMSGGPSPLATAIETTS